MTAEFLNAEQVLAEVDKYCASRGNPKLASVMRAAYRKDGKMPPAVMHSLRLEAVTMWRKSRKP